MHSSHKTSFSKGQRVDFVLMRPGRKGKGQVIGEAGDITAVICAKSNFRGTEPAIAGFFDLGPDFYRGVCITAEIANEAIREDLDYTATAVPFDQQPLETQNRISQALNQAHGGKIVPFKPRQSELVAQPEEPLKKTQFMITKSLDLKIKAMSFDPMVLAKLGVTEKQARTAILTKGLEFAIEWLEGGGEIEPVVVEQVKTDPVEAFYEERLASALATPEQLAQGEENHQLASLLTGRAGQLGISKRDLMCMMLNDYIYSNSSKGFWKLGEES